MKKFFGKWISWKVVLLLQFMASVLLIGSIVKLGALPMNYTYIAGAVLFILFLIVLVLVRPKNRKKKRSKVGKGISILLSIVMIVGSFAINKGQDALESISSASSQVTRFSLVVLDSSDYHHISDLEYKTIEYNSSVDAFYNELATDELSEYIVSVLVPQTDFIEMATHLYNGDTDAILVNEAYLKNMEEEYKDFDVDTRIIWNYDIREDTEDIKKEANVVNECFSVYVSGIDTRGPVATVSRSDVNMIVTVNPKTKQILLTSIPRDYYIDIAEFYAKDKLTHAGIYGVDNSVKTLENLFGIEINYFARLNFTSMETIVDALGGITVDSPYEFITKMGKYQINQGINHLNGKQALSFVRERKALPNGDHDRVRNQQIAIEAMVDKMTSPTIITNYSQILNSIAGSFETNMSAKEIASLLKLQLKEMIDWDIQHVQVDGEGVKQYGGFLHPYQELWYMIPNMESVYYAASLIEQMESDQIIVLE